MKLLPTALMLLTFSAFSQAVTPEDGSARLKQQRETFVKAESFATRPKTQDYKTYSAELEGYPLKPYFDLKTLVAFPYLANKEKIDRFLTEYRGTPLDKPLRRRWLNYLARQDQQALFLHYYQDINDISLDCLNLQYRLNRASLRDEALAEVEKYWVVGESQPKECDPVFKQWVKAGMRTEEHVWQRLTLAADGGKSTLIPYLKTLLPKEQQYLADLWLKVRRAPSYVSQLSQFPGNFREREADILSYGLSRLIWRDHELALKTWQKVQKRYVLNKAQQQRIAEKFAVALAIANDEQAETWLERANSLLEDEEIFRWHLAHVLRQQDWQHALEIIDVLPDDLSADLSFQYWQARSLEQLNDKPRAMEQFRSLANNRHYYGFLASGKLARDPSLVDRPLELSAETLSEVANQPAARRAYEFLQLKRYASARREWIYLQSQLSEQQNLAAAVIADSWGWHDQAIFTFSRVGYMDDIKRRFPLAYRDQLENNAKLNNIDPALAFAVARRESSFMIDANSGAGARGLMQLLPGTARYLAKRKVSSSSLYDPDENARFGTQYLRYLLDKVDNNPILATASYNAGWRRVKDWLPQTGSMPMDIWIETIPYRETRNYVKAVMAYRQIYASQLGTQSKLFENLANMQISAQTLIN